MSKAPVFLSIGKTFNEQERIVLARISTELARNGLAIETLENSLYNTKDPVLSIFSLMKACCGIVVVAFPRLHYIDGTEFPATEEERDTGERYLPTIWNQIEAALGYAFDLPMLGLVERHVHPEAFLNPRHKAYHVTPFDTETCQRDLPTDVEEAIKSFATRVRRKVRIEREASPFGAPEWNRLNRYPDPIAETRPARDSLPPVLHLSSDDSRQR